MLVASPLGAWGGRWAIGGRGRNIVRRHAESLFSGAWPRRDGVVMNSSQPNLRLRLARPEDMPVLSALMDRAIGEIGRAHV